MFNNEFRKIPALYWKKLSWRFNGKSLLIQPDQINMAVLFWCLLKYDAIVFANLYSNVHWTSHVLQGTRNTRSCITGPTVYTPEGLYIKLAFVGFCFPKFVNFFGRLPEELLHPPLLGALLNHRQGRLVHRTR